MDVISLGRECAELLGKYTTLGRGMDGPPGFNSLFNDACPAEEHVHVDVFYYYRCISCRMRVGQGIIMPQRICITAGRFGLTAGRPENFNPYLEEDNYFMLYCQWNI